MSTIDVRGVHDSHIDLDRYDDRRSRHRGGRPAPGRHALAGAPQHEPFAADGYELLLAGHTHGGQLCVPFYGALVTNCGIDRARVKGMSRHGSAYLHVSAGSVPAPTPRSVSPVTPRPAS